MPPLMTRPAMTLWHRLVSLTPRLAAFCLLVLSAVVLTAPLAAPAIAVTPPQPNWSALKPQQQEALKPLASEWDKIDHFRRKKWLGVADKYAGMKPVEQKRLHARMADWAKMTPEQRRAARENYNQAKALPPEQKKAEWQQYQKLPDVQKKQLAAAADAKKPVKQKQQRRAAEAEKKDGVQQTAKTRAPRQTAAPATGAPAAPAASKNAPPTAAPNAAPNAAPGVPPGVPQGSAGADTAPAALAPVNSSNRN